MISRRSFARVLGQAVIGSALALGMMPKKKSPEWEGFIPFRSTEGMGCAMFFTREFTMLPMEKDKVYEMAVFHVAPSEDWKEPSGDRWKIDENLIMKSLNLCP